MLMRKRPFWLAALPYLILFLSLGTPLTRVGAEEGKQPNIVLIISDDQAWTDYGFMGHPDIQTPNLDRMAKSSVLFRRGYVPTALCRPSLATLLTGHYASTHGITGNDPSPRRTPPNTAKYNQQRADLTGKLNQ